MDFIIPILTRANPKYYALTMLPYPSGDLHIGHWYAMTPSDARARYMRMKGFNVMFPMGFDAFGLPAENAAIKRNIHPKEWTYQNIANMREQFESMGQCLIGGGKQFLLIRILLPMDAMVFYPVYTRMDWRTARYPRWIGARIAIPPWRVSRFGEMTAIVNAAGHR